MISPYWFEDQRESLVQRGHQLENSSQTNGIMELQVLQVTPSVQGIGGAAQILVRFFNQYKMDSFRMNPMSYFQIIGGTRVIDFTIRTENQTTVLPGEENALYFLVSPLGDYSEYRFLVRSESIGGVFDPLYSQVPFRFRPDCYSSDCRFQEIGSFLPSTNLSIDYLARDYDSFRHILFSYLSSKVPYWQPSSEADLDQVLISLMAGEADQLMDFQDRIMAEAYFPTARKRVSLTRHARLLDYHVHQGKQSTAWMFAHVQGEESTNFILRAPFQVENRAFDGQLLYWSVKPGQQFYMSSKLNNLHLYSWGGARTILAEGSTEADLTTEAGDLTEIQAASLAAEIRKAGRLWIEEIRNPDDGGIPGHDFRKRQILVVPDDEKSAFVQFDPINHQYLVRVRWNEENALTESYVFRVRTEGTTAPGALFHGNLFKVSQGQFVTEQFSRDGQTGTEWEETKNWGTLCRLRKGSVLYRSLTDSGRKMPLSTVFVEVLVGGRSLGDWREVESLAMSDDSDRGGQHFVVETDENRQSTVRFGNGIQGQALPSDAVVKITYQVGKGELGNVGADRVQFRGDYIDPQDHSLRYGIDVRNPWEISDGIGPESKEQILRRAPELYMRDQPRIVTLSDLEEKARKIPYVEQAKSFYVWTGSWRSMRLLVDLKPPIVWSERMSKNIREELEPMLMVGDELELRPPRYIPLIITVTACVKPGFSKTALLSLLKDEFSAGFTSTGKKGFFHPSLWTFGQGLKISTLLGRMHQIEGLDHVDTISSVRWGTQITPVIGDVDIQTDEIIQVLNNPDGAEKGYINFKLLGERP